MSTVERERILNKNGEPTGRVLSVTSGGGAYLIIQPILDVETHGSKQVE